MSASNLDVIGAPQKPVRLWERVLVSTLVRECAMVRISDPTAREDLDKLRHALQRQAASDDAGGRIGRALASLGPSVTDETDDGERDRRRARLAAVFFNDLDPRATKKLLAYAGVVDEVLVMLVPSSALEANLPPHPGDRTVADRNGATELVLEAIVRVPWLEVLAVPRIDRLFRRPDFQGRIQNELRQHDVLLLDERGVHDLSDQTQMTLTTLHGATAGDADVQTRRTNMLAGRLHTITPKGDAPSRRDTRYSSCPPGYGPLWEELPDGARRPIPKSIVVDTAWCAAIRLGWEMFAAGATWRQMVDALVEFHIPLRDARGKQLRDVKYQSQRQILKRVFSERNARLHRTGEWELTRSTRGAIKMAGGVPLTRQLDGRRSATVRGRLPVHRVEGLPWGIADDVWNAVFARFRTGKDVTPSDNGRKGSRSLMHSSTPVWQSDRWVRLVKSHSVLQLRSMPGDPDAPPSWDWTEHRLEAACNLAQAWNRIGAELMFQLGRAGAGEARLIAPSGVENDAVRSINQELAELNDQIEDARAGASTAGLLAAQALRENLSAAARDHLAQQERYLRAVEGAEARIAELRLTMEDLRHKSADVRADLSTAAGAAAALLRWSGGDGDDTLRFAVRQLGLTDSMRATRNELTGGIDIAFAAQIRLIDGTLTQLPCAVSLPNSSNKRDIDGDGDGLIADWCRGASLEKLARDHSRSLRWVRATMLAWLAKHGIEGMATALLDCPVLTTRQIVVASIAHDLVRMPRRTSDGSKIEQPTIDLIARPYVTPGFGRWKSWAGYQHAADRRLLAVLRVGRGVMDVAPLRTAAGADPVSLARPQGGRPPLAIAPMPRQRGLRSCPHPDCAAPMVWHVLYVPETAAAGLICSACRRLPDVAFAAAPLPPEYLVKWDLSRDGEIGTTVRATAESLRIPNVPMAKRGTSLLRPSAAAKVLGVTLITFDTLQRKGKLPQPVQVGGIRMWLMQEIVDLAVRREAGLQLARNDGLLSTSEAARRLGVTQKSVYQYMWMGRLPYVSMPPGSKPKYGLRPDAVVQFTPPAGDLLRSMSVTSAATQSGLTPGQIRYAMSRGALAPAVDSHGQRRVLAEVFEEWLGRRTPARRATVPPSGSGVTRRSDRRMTVAAVASALGMSPKQVRKLADNGVLNDNRACGSGWRWFDAEEVDQYRKELSRRRPDGVV